MEPLIALTTPTTHRDGGSPQGAASRWLAALAAVLVLSLALAALPMPATASSGGAPMLLGLATDDFRADLPEFEREAGRQTDFLQLFWSLGSDFPQPWAPALLEDVHQLGATPYLEITTPDFAGFDAGGYQDRLDGLVANVKEWMENGPGRNMVVAPLPEANLGQFSWGNNPEGYKRGFVRIRNAFLDAGIGLDRVRFVFAMNGPGSDSYDYDSYYPGDDVVDIIGFSKLNRGDPWRDYQATFGVHIDEMQQLIGTSKPIIITQTASVTSGGDRSAWLDDMFRGLQAEDQVIGAVYFNRLKTEGTVERDYRILVNGVLDSAFDAGFASWNSAASTSWLFDGGLDAWVTSRAGNAVDPAPAESGIFDDVGGSPFIDDITWLAETGITSGCNPPANSLFCPDDPVTRGQMAAFLVRALGYTETGSEEFVDDDPTPFENDIERLAHAGVTTGCNPPVNDSFCPDDAVTRGQMAAFLVRALGLSGSGTDFVDDGGSVFEADIETLAAAGITAGCNPPVNDRFCPNDPVTRGQMAAFLHRALG